MTAYAFGKGFAGAFGKGMKDSPFNPNTQFEDGISIDEAGEKSGLNFPINETQALYMVNGVLHESPEKCLYRGDTGEFLSNMSERFKVVQPMDLLETHRNYLDIGGYYLRAAGIFRNGARFWSMAEAHGEFTFPDGDKLKSYLFMASAVDGSSATYAIGTGQLMSCWNQAPAIIRDAKKNGKFIRVSHSAIFDADKARRQLASVDDNFKLWCEDARYLSEQKISIENALLYYAQVFDIEPDEEDNFARIDAVMENKRVQQCLELFTTSGEGVELKSKKGTAWGLYNSITEYADHYVKAETPENRFASATMGNGARMKSKAWEQAINMLA